ncbi:hypothetical protein DVH24_007385 [Malus domestica]|uniref:GDT1 family protein n=1 Tax=Malus domestica TaxID=3750 RepID=A0A498HGJ5_MALDO|nr:hypothetical protein DVH24_007385 [Malus domestica]
MSTVVQGFTKSLAMTVLSEIGDKTFFAAAILAMRHPRRLVLAGCLGALIVMTILSVLVGLAAPNLFVRKLEFASALALALEFGVLHPHLLVGKLMTCTAMSLTGGVGKLVISLFLFMVFLWDKDDADLKANTGGSKRSKDDDDKKQRRSFLLQFFSPIFLKLATIGLAADENPLGVVLGGILGQALCTTAAVLGGKSLASQISEKIGLMDDLLTKELTSPPTPCE